LRPLKQAITTKFVRIGNDYLESIFSDGGNGPLSTFSAKIKLAYALGIVSAETRLQIERVREVRNHFAHHKDKVSFKHPSVMSVCSFFKQKKSLTEEDKETNIEKTYTKIYVCTNLFLCIIGFEKLYKKARIGRSY